MSEPKTLYVCDRIVSLEEAQKFVGGFVEMIQLPGNRQLLCNEDGLLLRLDINREVSYMLQRVIVGNCMILSEKALWD